MSTLHDLIAAARQRLRAAGIPAAEADLDARLLLQHLLGWDTARTLAHGTDPASADLTRRYETVVARREHREPLAYITGRQAFWDLEIEVTPAVLVPRPETEIIVEVSLAHFPERDAPLSIADVCTGSGCLAVALACERPAARVLATDLSGAALEVAGRNAVRHGVADRVALRRADLLAGAGAAADAHADAEPDGFHLVVSNPPYVPAGDAGTIQPEVRHEPSLALYAGADGLDVIQRLLPQAAARLAPAGLLVFEFGFGQADAVEAEVRRVPALELIEIRQDLQGIPRTAVARRRH